MTVEDAFEARLRAAFVEAEPKDAESFSRRVLGRLENTGQRRLLMLGGAGALGSAIASTQLEALFQHVERAKAVADWLQASPAGGVLTPEVLAAATIALAVSALAMFLPGRT